jgi:hypothetical protein
MGKSAFLLRGLQQKLPVRVLRNHRESVTMSSKHMDFIVPFRTAFECPWRRSPNRRSVAVRATALVFEDLDAKALLEGIQLIGPSFLPVGWKRHEHCFPYPRPREISSCTVGPPTHRSISRHRPPTLTLRNSTFAHNIFGEVSNLWRYCTRLPVSPRKRAVGKSNAPALIAKEELWG